ncbi:MAG: nucleotidyltransferase domain-containing protein [Desulfobaccales bacterium]
MLNQTDRNIVEELKRRLRKKAEDRLQAVIVYGSRAWGESGPDSDLDVAVIVRGLIPDLEAAYQVMWDFDFTPIIALKVFDADSFAAYQEKGFSFYRKLFREGLAL